MNLNRPWPTRGERPGLGILGHFPWAVNGLLGRDGGKGLKSLHFMVWAIALAVKMPQPGSSPNIGPEAVSQHPKGMRPEESVDLTKE